MRYELVNSANADFLGLPEAEIIGKSDDELMSPEVAKACRDTDLQAIREKKMIISQQQIGNATYENFKFPVVVNGEVRGVAGIIRDITERKQAEREKEHLQAQLRHAQKMEAVGTLAGGIAHDFNNILSSVIGYTELALDDAEEGSLLAANLFEVLRAGNRARDLVKQILAVSRQKEQVFQPIQINPLLKETITLLRKSIPASIDFQQEITSKPMLVNTDPVQLSQAIVNLATNAKNAIPDNSGWIVIRAELVAIDENVPQEYPAIQPGNFAKITVKDSGIGISAQDIEKIFDPYFTTREKRVGGIGLGLSVVHGIVERHQGYIKVDSKPGKGTTVHIYLPLVEQSVTDGSLDL